MLYNRCTGIYKFGNNTYPRCIRRRSILGHIFRETKVHLTGREIRYVTACYDAKYQTSEGVYFLYKIPILTFLKLLMTESCQISCCLL